MSSEKSGHISPTPGPLHVLDCHKILRTLLLRLIIPHRRMAHNRNRQPARPGDRIISRDPLCPLAPLEEGQLAGLAQSVEGSVGTEQFNDAFGEPGPLFKVVHRQKRGLGPGGDDVLGRRRPEAGQSGKRD